MKLFGLILFLFIGSIATAQDFFTLRGYVYDEDNLPLPAVEIRVKNTGLGTITNELGQYELRLESGLNRLIFNYIGYQSQTFDIVLKKDLVKNVWLVPDDNVLAAVEIIRKKRDISYEVVQHVIDRKDSLNERFHSHKSEVYIKSVEEIESRKKDKQDDEVPEKADFTRFENAEMEITKQAGDSGQTPNLNLYEAQIVRHFQQPNQIKEERLAVKRFGDQSSLFYTSTTEGDFNLYTNLLYIRTLGQNALVSPFSNTAFISYKFKISDIYADSSGHKIYRIKVIPRKLGNALFKGEIEVYDEIWQLKSAQLEVPKTALILYDKFSFTNFYSHPDSTHVISGQQFNWSIKNAEALSNGDCKVLYSNHVFDTIYAKKFFNSELRVTLKEAYEKDTTFWSRIRPEPLTVTEQKFVRYNDSMRMVRTSTVYLDSIDSIYNRITPLKLLWSGQGFINRAHKRNFEFSPLVSLLDPVAIGGWRVRYYMEYYKRYENRKTLSISPFFNYGFKNQDMKGSLSVFYMYNPLKISYIGLSTGRYFDFVNPFASIASILRRDNFYEKNYISIYHNTELVNGLYLDVDVNYEQRQNLTNFEFSSVGDSLFPNNTPVYFDNHSALTTGLTIRYTPKQLYLKEPFEKIVLGSKFPTFSLSLNKAWDNVLQSKIKYTYAEFSIYQKFNVGIFGVSEYRFTMGKFLDTTSLRIMDYRYQRAGDPYFFTPAMYTYQLLDSTFPTFKVFFEGHYVHQFNGFIMNRIPILKKTNIKTMAGAGFLIAPERSYEYAELFFGVNRIFKIGKERLRLGVHYTVAQSNQFGFRDMFKISFEFYNRTKNTWSF